MQNGDAASDCDCGSLSVHSFINHRGEPMRARQARSATRRTRGLGEVRSVRSRSSDDLGDSELDVSVHSLPSRAPAPVVASSENVSGMGGRSQVLQYNGELFVPMRAINAGRRPSAPSPIVATRRSSNSNLPDYLYYTLRTDNPAGEGKRPESAMSGNGCRSCEELRARVQRLERENSMLRTENRSLTGQLSAARRSVLALERSSLSEAAEAAEEEKAALRTEISDLRALVESGTGGGAEGHKESVLGARELLLGYMEGERKEKASELAACRATIAETQELLLEERRLRREAVTEAESRLAVENGSLKAKVLEKEHRTQLEEDRVIQLATEKEQLKEKVRELNAALGRTPGILPDISSEESTLLLLPPWSDLPPEVTDCMDSPGTLRQLLMEEDGLEEDGEMLRCLWYRARVQEKALGLLQARVCDILGVEDAEGLEEAGRKLVEEREKAEIMGRHVEALELGKREMERREREREGALILERNEALSRLDMATARLKLQDDSNTRDVDLNRLLSRLNDLYDGAGTRDEAERLSKENSLLRAGRGESTSIPEVLDISDPHLLRIRCVEIANERDSLRQELEGERERNSDGRREEHLRNLEAELAQTSQDRSELRQQVAHFSGRLTDALAAHEEQMRDKDREAVVMRLKLQEMTQEKDEIRMEWEKEKRNANDLKVTFHKEIKNQSAQAKREMEAEVSELRRELDLALRRLRAAESERDAMMEEAKQAGNDRMMMIEDEIQPRMYEALTCLPPDLDVAPESDPELQASIRRTDEVGSALLTKLNGEHLADLRNGVLDMTAKFDLERSAYKSQLQQLLVDLRSLKTRLRATEQTKAQLDAACKAFERKLSNAKDEAAGTKAMKEDNNKLMAELQQLNASKAVSDKLTASLRGRVEQLRREKRELRQSAGQNDNRVAELQQSLQRTREEKDKALVEHQLAVGERDRYRSNFLTQQDKSAKLEQQLKVLREEFENHHKGAKEKNQENFNLRDSLMTSEQTCTDFRLEISNLKDLLRKETERSGRVMDERKSLEEEIRKLKGQLLEAGDGDSMADVGRKIAELKERVTELQSSLKMKDNSSQDLEAQVMAYQDRLEDLENEISQERNLQVMSKTRCDALEDENEWLRTQNMALHRRVGTPRGDVVDNKSRGELVNELIIRSQSKAQALLASNPNLVRALTPNGLVSPSSDMTDHLPIFLNQSFER